MRSGLSGGGVAAAVRAVRWVSLWRSGFSVHVGGTALEAGSTRSEVPALPLITWLVDSDGDVHVSKPRSLSGRMRLERET